MRSISSLALLATWRRHGLLPALTRALPNFMVPRQVHWRQVMPVSPNGKLDRVALAAELAQDVQA